MIYRFQVGQQPILLLDNIQKDGTYGDSIVKCERWYIQTDMGSCYITDYH
jgi:hypothetical protein